MLELVVAVAALAGALLGLGLIMWTWAFWLRTLQLAGWSPGVALVVSGAGALVLWPFWCVYMAIRMVQGRHR